MKTERRLYTVEELAKIIHLAPNSVYIKALKGEIPCIRFGRTVRFDLNEVLAEGKKRRDWR